MQTKKYKKKTNLKMGETIKTIDRRYTRVSASRNIQSYNPLQLSLERKIDFVKSLSPRSKCSQNSRIYKKSHKNYIPISARDKKLNLDKIPTQVSIPKISYSKYAMLNLQFEGSTNESQNHNYQTVLQRITSLLKHYKHKLKQSDKEKKDIKQQNLLLKQKISKLMI